MRAKGGVPRAKQDCNGPYNPMPLIVQHEQMSQGGLRAEANEDGAGVFSKTCVGLTGEG